MDDKFKKGRLYMWNITNLGITVYLFEVFYSWIELIAFVGILGLDVARQSKCEGDNENDLSFCLSSVQVWKGTWVYRLSTVQTELSYHQSAIQLMLCSDAEGNEPWFCSQGPGLISYISPCFKAYLSRAIVLTNQVNKDKHRVRIIRDSI